MNQQMDQSFPANVLTVAGNLNFERRETELHLADGRVILIPTSLLAQNQPQSASLAVDLVQDGSVLIPLIEEQLVVGKQTVQTAKVRLQKTVQLYEEALNEPLAVRTYDIERIVLNRPVDTAPAVREEGLTTIYPLVEEQLVLTKQLILKEEVRVTRRDTERRDTQVVSLRREHLLVEREPLS